MKHIFLISGLVLSSTAVFAKLPPLSDDAKAKAAEAAAKTAWTTKKETYLLCKSQDKVAAHYLKTAASPGKDKPPQPAVDAKATAPAASTPCVDVGPFVYVAPDAKPLEAAGAHSPTATSVSPPSGKQPAATVVPTPAPKAAGPAAAAPTASKPPAVASVKPAVAAPAKPPMAAKPAPAGPVTATVTPPAVVAAPASPSPAPVPAPEAAAVAPAAQPAAPATPPAADTAAPAVDKKS